MTSFRELTAEERNDLEYREIGGTVVLAGPIREAVLEVEPGIVLGPEQMVTLHMSGSALSHWDGTTKIESRIPACPDVLSRCDVSFRQRDGKWTASIPVHKLLLGLLRPGLTLELSSSFERAANRPALLRIL